jgi:hypothetical protein
MLFGQSVFQSVLDRLKAEDEDASDDAAPTSHRVPGFTTSLAFDVMEGVSAPSAQPGQAYIDNLEVETAPSLVNEVPVTPEPVPEPVMPAHLERTAPQEIAAELAISQQDTVQSLGDKRRAFAKTNHPDGIHPLFRDNATKRMTVANLLIDEAIRRRTRSGRR